jgi:HD-GYP domain-containing protein (c-di-GMP phosphodiesterase class II)
VVAQHDRQTGTSERAAELVGSLSLACDIGAGLAAESGLRTAVIAARLARLSGHGRPVQRDAYFAGVLRFLGCSSFAHEEASLNGGNDQAFVSMYADVDLGDPMQFMGRTFTSLNGYASPLNRAVSVVRLLADPKSAAKISAAHCSAAVMLAGKLGMTVGVARALDQMYERWDGGGQPRNLTGDAIDGVARILHAAHVAEVHHRIGGIRGARSEVRRRRGKHFDPEVVAAFEASDAELFEGLDEPSVWDHFLAAEPTPPTRINHRDRLSVAGAFAHYADLKSPFFLGHSVAVAALARAAAEGAGLSSDEAQDIALAGLLHDLGRVALPNGLLEKAAPFNRAESERLRSIPAETTRILSGSSSLGPLANLAGAAYERVDGSGYHRGLAGSALSMPARVLAAAEFHRELTEERANRPALTIAEASGLLSKEVLAGRIDRAAAQAVLAAAGDRVTRVKRALPDGLSEREVEVLAHLARGHSNRIIAERLGVSARTIQTHVMHIFEKTGIRGRAAAALYAVERNIA